MISPVSERIEQAFSDWRLRHFTPDFSSSSVVVLAIDDAVLDLVGPWPWPRSTTAVLLDKLFSRYGPAAVGLDMIFPPGAPASEDAALARALADRPIVVSQLFTAESSERGVARYQSFNIRTGLPHFDGVLASSNHIRAESGHINALIDSDGQLRRVWPVACTRSGCAPSLAAQMFGMLTGAQSWHIEAGKPWQGHWLLAPDSARELTIPMDVDFTAVMPWRAPPAQRYISAAEVWQGTLPVDVLRNRIVLIGATAPALGDRINTPLGQNFPGVETHARLLDAWLENRIPYTPRLAPLGLALLWFVQTIFLLQARQQGRSLAVRTMILALMPALLNGWLYWAYSILLPLALPIFYPILFGLSLFIAGLYADRSWIMARIGSYLPAPLVRQLREHGQDPEEETRWTTVLYADIIGSTAASVQLQPHELAHWNNLAIDLAVKEISERGGSIDNIAGDGLMAYWRDALPADQAQQALSAVQAIMRGLERLNAEQLPAWPKLQMGMGVHAGPLLAGSYGQHRRRYTILGEVANIAFRIERHTRTLSAHQLISAAVVEHAPGWSLTWLASVTVRGAEKPIDLYTFTSTAQS